MNIIHIYEGSCTLTADEKMAIALVIVTRARDAADAVTIGNAFGLSRADYQRARDALAARRHRARAT